jgi:putative heme-binding domain-containing protein
VGHWRQEDPGVIPSGDVYGFGSPTGIVVYENGALPKKHRGMLLSCEPGNNVVYGYHPQIKGAGFTLKKFDFMVTDVPKRIPNDDRNSHAKRGKKGAYDSRAVDTMFRPSDVAVGPDGAIYVADWFDVRLSGHATFDPGLRGTIYRIAPKGFVSKIPSLDLKTVEGQVDALRNPACNVRALGLYALEKSGAKAIPEVKKLLEDENPYMQGRGIWALSKLGPQGLKEVEAILKSDSDTLRLVAFRALRRANHRLLEHANTLAGDPSIRVRREVALAMRDLPFEKAGPVLLKLAAGYTEEDRWNLEAFGTGCTGKEDAVYAALRKQQAASPLEWSARFADIAWRLHPENALDDFKTRAMSEKIEAKERSRCLTAIAFMKSEKAALTMLELSKAAPQETRVMASWWLFHPEQSIWRTYAEIAKVIKPAPVTEDYLIPKTFGTVTEGLTQETVLALQGDVTRGKAVAARCYVCHKIEDLGALFGPDISGYSQSRPVEVTVSDILDPALSISRGFEGTRVVMKNGNVIEGLLQSLTTHTMQLTVMGGGSLTVARREVKSYKKMTGSMMPSAANMGMSAQDVSDVAAYLKSIKLK